MFVCLLVCCFRDLTQISLLRDPCMLVCLGFIHTLEIITRILIEVVNREKIVRY